ncbi:DUF1344 domain-containing protein [Mesorhizobium salmacidum]|uniref:DUF1344 domain-containing protein n=2 Tax=Mesorhizobium TaxID=68287 RepID=A0ABU8KUJ1_9HYPH
MPEGNSRKCNRFPFGIASEQGGPRLDATGRPKDDADHLREKGCPLFQEYISMRKIIVSAAAAALLASGSVAFAAVKHTTGTVKTFDTASKSLVLDNGSSFTLPETFKDPGLKVGEKVRITWDMSGKNKVAEAVKIVK